MLAPLFSLLENEFILYFSLKYNLDNCNYKKNYTYL